MEWPGEGSQVCLPTSSLPEDVSGFWCDGAGGAGMSLRSAWPVGLEVSFVFSGCCVPEICRYVLPSCRLWSSVESSYRRLVGAVVSCGVRGGCRYVISLELSSEVMGVVSTVVSSSESCLSFYCRVYVCAGYFNLQQLAFYIVSSSRVL